MNKYKQRLQPDCSSLRSSAAEVQGVAAGLESVFTTLKKITSFVLACSLSKYLQYLDRVFILFFTKNKTNVQTSTPQKL